LAVLQEHKVKDGAGNLNKTAQFSEPEAESASGLNQSGYYFRGFLASE
jgi:hypothetical protein